MPANESSSEVFERLKAILQEHAPQLTVMNDEPRFYLLRTKVLARRKLGHAFGAVMAIASVVKFNLGALVWYHDLREQESPELRKHTRDFTNFDFQASGDDLTDDLLTELAGLTKTCLERMMKDRRA